MQQRVKSGAHPGDVTAERLTSNLLTFGRDLRSAGLKLGSGQIMSFVAAVGEIDARIRNDFYHAARTTMLTSPEQIPTFDSEFARFWSRVNNPLAPVEAEVDPNELNMPPPPGSEPTDRREKQSDGDSGDGKSAKERAILAVEDTGDDDGGQGEDVESLPKDVLVFSAREVLRKKDFSQYSPDEIAEARRIIKQMNWRLGTRVTRRRERANNGPFIDYRATLRRSLRNQGVPIELRRRRRKERMRPLVLICDISGSMDRYARLLLQFVHALEHGLDSVEVFVFGTRLTRITRELRKRDFGSAIEQVVKSVDDWSGGTRIGDSIKTFNFKWSRRVLRSGATVVMISDGWDRGDPQLLSQEMARLQRSCRRLIWLNPLLGAPGYQPLTQGIRAALPYVDAFLPIHNLKSLEALARLLGEVEDQAPVRRQSSIIGSTPDKLPGKPKIGARGELMIDVGPRVAGKPQPRSGSRGRYAS
ncbi:MAG: vWA domain-containing protein [Thermomicrobiales bacterium]